MLRSHASYGVICLPRWYLLLLSHKIRIPTESTQRGHELLFAILTIIYYITKTLRSEVTAHSSTSSCAYPHINMRAYVGGCVRAGAYNLILIFASYYYAPWTYYYAPWMDRSVKGTAQGFSFCGATRNMAPHK